MNSPGIPGSALLQKELIVCPQCSSTSRVWRGLCLNCLLCRGLCADTQNNETLESVLDEINVRDADWRVGNYQILEEIGRGGMGVIYRARQRHSRRIVALKRILSYHADSRETLVRFRREAEAAASLDHPNILPIYEVGEGEDGLPFFSMKFAAGGSLLDMRSALHGDPRQIVRLMAKVTRAVQCAHRQGILHRDLKPGNILLDGRGEPLVSDFGLAKWLDASSDLTRTLTVFGTPGYIAPEQAQGPANNLTAGADVYSIGAILFDLFTGRPPFLGEHALAVIKQAAEKPAPKLRSLVPHADRDLETICAQCLQREPEARYHSASDLAQDLQRWLEGRSIAARPVLPHVRVWRWAKRNPVLSSSIAACMILLVAAAGISTQSDRLRASVRESDLAKHSIVVLPFLDLGDASLDSEMAGVIATSLRAEINRIGPARIIAISEPIDPLPAMDGSGGVKRAARKYGARAVIAGTCRPVKGGTRVSMRLLDPDGNLLLRRAVEVPSRVSGATQLSRTAAATVYSILDKDDFVERVSSQQDPALRNKDVRELILAARELMERQNVRDIDRGIECLQHAIEGEPKSSLARAYFSRFAGIRTHYQFDARLLERAHAEANEALKLNPQSSEAHRAVAGMLFQDGNLDLAHDEILNCIEMDGPDVPAVSLVGNLSKLLGHPVQALAWYEAMARWQRRPADDVWMIGDCWSDLCDDQRAESVYRRVSELHREVPEGWIGLCRLRLLQRDFEGARAICSQYRNRYDEFEYSAEIAAQLEFFARNFAEAEKLYSDLLSRDPAGGRTFYGALSYRSALGRLRMVSHVEEAHKILTEEFDNELRAFHSAPHQPEVLYRLAALESCLGKTGDSLMHLAAAMEAGWIDYRSLNLDPRFDLIRSDPQFKDLIDKLVDRVHQMKVTAAKSSFASSR